MSRLLIHSVLAFTLPALLGFRAALASSAVVPDGFATVQSAIDSGADTVRIREGVYPERAIVDHVMVLEGIGAGTRPRLDGLSIYNTDFWAVPRLLSVSGIDFVGRVECTTVYYRPRLLQFSFADCAGLESSGV
jgi:hypothetical protein